MLRDVTSAVTDSLLSKLPFRLKYWCTLKIYWSCIFAEVHQKKNLKLNSSRTFYLLKTSFSPGKGRKHNGKQENSTNRGHVLTILDVFPGLTEHVALGGPPCSRCLLYLSSLHSLTHPEQISNSPPNSPALSKYTYMCTYIHAHTCTCVLVSITFSIFIIFYLYLL